jgi:hypothetical protein
VILEKQGQFSITSVTFSQDGGQEWRLAPLSSTTEWDVAATVEMQGAKATGRAGH